MSVTACNFLIKVDYRQYLLIANEAKINNRLSAKRCVIQTRFVLYNFRLKVTKKEKFSRKIYRDY